MLSIIVAVAENNVIGKDNKLIWHISEDLKYFKSVTNSAVVIMGRKTFESIGKALPNRINIVISRNNTYQAEGCIICDSLTSAIKEAEKHSLKEIFVIGGESIYKEALPLANKIYLTRVYKVYKGDTYFPNIDFSLWKESKRINFERGEKYKYPFSFIVYDKI